MEEKGERKKVSEGGREGEMFLRLGLRLGLGLVVLRYEMR